jgi:hypothetical protein
MSSQYAIPSNPWTPDLSVAVVPTAATSPWFRPHTSDTVAGVAAEILSSRINLAIPTRNEVSGLQWIWDNQTDSRCPSMAVKLFEDFSDAAQGNFFVKFRVSLFNISQQITGSPDACAAGVGICSDEVFLPIIEFGTVDGTTKKIFHSYGGGATYTDQLVPIGSTCTVAFTLTVPFWVRVVRNDNVVFAEVSQTGADGTWTNISTSSATGCWRRNHSTLNETGVVDFALNRLCFYARTGGTSPSLYGTYVNHGCNVYVDNLSMTVWPRFASAPRITELRARTNPDGDVIDLLMSLPVGEDLARSMRIVRHLYAHPGIVKPDESAVSPLSDNGYVYSVFGEVLYEGLPVESYTDTLTTRTYDRHYYYAVHLSRSPVSTNFSTDGTAVSAKVTQPSDSDYGLTPPAENVVTGLSVWNRQGSETNVMLRHFPRVYQDMDENDRVQLGRTAGLLADITSWLNQGGYNLMRGLLQGARSSNDPDTAPLGKVGSVDGQQAIVNAKLLELGIRGGLDALEGIAKRRLWRYANDVRSTKGSTMSLLRLLALCTGWVGSTVQEVPCTCLHTVSKYETCETFLFTTYPSLSYAAGMVYGFVGLEVNKYAGGYFEDWLGRRVKIASNTETTLMLEDSAFVGSNVINFTGISLLGNQVRAFVDQSPYTLQHGVPNDRSYIDDSIGPRLMSDHMSSVVAQPITNSVYTDVGVCLYTPSPGVFQAGGANFVLAYGFESDDIAKPTTMAKLYTQCFPTTLYNHDYSLSDTVASITLSTLWNGSQAGPGSSENDVVFTAPSGAARFVSESDVCTVTHTSIIVPSASALYPIVRPGDYVKPNWNQPRWFRILSVYNVDSTHALYVTETVSGVEPADVVVSSGNVLVVAPYATIARERLFRDLAKTAATSDCRIFVHYV